MSVGQHEGWRKEKATLGGVRWGTCLRGLRKKGHMVSGSMHAYT
jgi:hypothetical protein